MKIKKSYRIFESPSAEQVVALYKKVIDEGHEKLRYFISLDGKLFVWDAWYENHQPVIEHLGYDYKEIYQAYWAKGNIELMGFIQSEADVQKLFDKALEPTKDKAASLKKKAASSGWLAPNGVFYDLSGGTHYSWVRDNRKMLLEKYGIDISINSTEFWLVVDALVNYNWVRITGDLKGGFYVRELSNIPSALEDWFFSNPPNNFLNIIIEEVDENRVTIDLEQALENGLQETIDRELRTPAIAKKKTSSVYTDKEMEEFYIEQHEYGDSDGGGNDYHDWMSNTNDFPKPEDLERPKVRLDRWYDTDTPIASYEVTYVFSLPKGGPPNG